MPVHAVAGHDRLTVPDVRSTLVDSAPSRSRYAVSGTKAAGKIPPFDVVLVEMTEEHAHRNATCLME